MGKVISEAADKHAEKVRTGKVDKPDPEKVMLAVFPPDLVCAQVVRALDGELLHDDGREDWVDDTHSDVVRHVALEVLRESDVEPETEDEQGGRLRRFVRYLVGSAGGGDADEDERTEPPADSHILIAARRLDIGIREAAWLVGQRVTARTYHRLMEYRTFMDIHHAETQAARMKDRQQASDLSQRASDDAPDAWDLYWRVRMGID